MVKAFITEEGRELALSNLDKVLWPEDGFTKGELINYYIETAPYILSHLKDRPLVFTRFPNGIEGKSFYQKNVPEYLPEWMSTYLWKSKDTVNQLLLVGGKDGLAWLANQACIEIHPWLSRKDSIMQPDFIVFDLDPSEGSTFDNVVEIAYTVKELMDKLDLRVYLKTSGAEGVHVYLPINAKYTYAEVREFAMRIAEYVCLALPKIATIERKVAQRGTKVYFDYMQNVIGKTICAPYSVRPRKGAPVSAPITWSELEHISPSDFNIKNILPRLNEIGDIFSPVTTDKQCLDKAINYLNVQLSNKSLSH